MIMKICAPQNRSGAEEDPLSLLLPQSGNKSQLPLQVSGAKALTASATALISQWILSLSLLLPLCGNKIQLCPLAVLRSRFGFAISRSRTAAVEIPRFILHRRRSEFLPLHRGAEIRTPLPRCAPPQLRPPRCAQICRRAPLHGQANFVK